MQRPLTSNHERVLGPGVADMKGGLVVALMALEALTGGPRSFGSVELHSVPDEESRTTGPATLPRMLGADAVLVLECGREGGNLVEQRKAGATLHVVAKGQAAHAGTERQRGKSALLGLCREVHCWDALNGARPGLNVNVGKFRAGTASNVVPENGDAWVDVRAQDSNDLEWAIARIEETGGRDGVEFETNRSSVWPAMTPAPATKRLLSVARYVARQLGHNVLGQASGGMSDGNWTASRGLPTLDGLGPIGANDHSPDEYIDLRSVPLRCALISGLVSAVSQSRQSDQAWSCTEKEERHDRGSRPQGARLRRRVAD